MPEQLGCEPEGCKFGEKKPAVEEDRGRISSARADPRSSLAAAVDERREPASAAARRRAAWFAVGRGPGRRRARLGSAAAENGLGQPHDRDMELGRTGD